MRLRKKWWQTSVTLKFTLRLIDVDSFGDSLSHPWRFRSQEARSVGFRRHLDSHSVGTESCRRSKTGKSKLARERQREQRNSYMGGLWAYLCLREGKRFILIIILKCKINFRWESEVTYCRKSSFCSFNRSEYRSLQVACMKWGQVEMNVPSSPTGHLLEMRGRWNQGSSTSEFLVQETGADEWPPPAMKTVK